MTQGIPESGKILVLAPHPDDEALGCAGTLALLNRKGVRSTVVFVTDGERLYDEPSEKVAEKRREEGRAASAILGCEEPVFLGFPDGKVGDQAEAVGKRLADIIALKKPDIVFSPSPVDFHQDHLAVSRIALKSLEDAGNFRIAFYEVYSTVRFTHLMDIGEVVEQKTEAIMNYRTSLYERPEVYVHASLGLNAQRSLYLQKKGYYEAFWILERSLSREEVKNWLMYE